MENTRPDVPNPKGTPNMNIGKNKGRRGPTTDIHQVNANIASGFLRNGIYSKVLKRVMKCPKCPLGAREVTRYIKNEPVKFFLPAKCRYYAIDNSKCNYQPVDFIAKIRTLQRLEKAGWDETKIMEMLSQDAISDAAMCREVEFMETGKPGTGTERFQEQAIGATEKLHKMKYGEVNKNLNVNVDLSQQILDTWAKRKQQEEARKDENDKKPDVVA